jgi:hypothetical protein
MINSLPYHIQNNIVYNMEGNRDGCSHSYNSDFSISRGCNTNYNSLFQSTDGLCSKPEFKFALGSASHKL